MGASMDSAAVEPLSGALFFYAQLQPDQHALYHIPVDENMQVIPPLLEMIMRM